MNTGMVLRNKNGRIFTKERVVIEMWKQPCNEHRNGIECKIETTKKKNIYDSSANNG